MVRWSRKISAFSEHGHSSSGAGGQVVGCGKFYLFVMNVSEGQTLWVCCGVFSHIQCKIF